MPVYRLPWNSEEQINVCVALKNHGFLTITEKDEVAEIERELKIMHKELTESQKAFLEKMIERHGSSIEI